MKKQRHQRMRFEASGFVERASLFVVLFGIIGFISFCLLSLVIDMNDVFSSFYTGLLLQLT